MWKKLKSSFLGRYFFALHFPDILFFSCVLFFFIYLTYHTVYGPRGYYAWQTHKERKISEEVLVKKMRETFEYLQNEVNIFQKSVDGDRLEQYAWVLFRKLDPKLKVVFL